MLDFDDVDTTDNNCELTDSERRILFTTAGNTSGGRRSCLVYNSCGLTPSQTAGHT